jgi:hypothetical protein
MSKDKLADALGNLESQMVESWRSGWNSYLRLVTDVARNPSSLSEAQKNYWNYLSRTAPRDFLKVVEAGTLCYTAIAESGSELASQFLKRASAATDAPDADSKRTAPSEKPPAAVSEFTFQGYEGETTGRQFLVTNHSAQAVTITFVVSGFVSAAGESASIPTEFDPSEFSLAPGEEKVVACRLQIPSSLPPGIEYCAQLSATDLPALSVRLRVRSLGPRAEPEITVGESLTS